MLRQAAVLVQNLSATCEGLLYRYKSFLQSVAGCCTGTMASCKLRRAFVQVQWVDENEGIKIFLQSLMLLEGFSGFRIEVFYI